MGHLYLQAGDRDRALEWLQRASEVRDPNVPYLRAPEWDPVRSDPRFQNLMRRVGLPRSLDALVPSASRQFSRVPSPGTLPSRSRLRARAPGPGR
jgi:hypothetical protein